MDLHPAVGEVVVEVTLQLSTYVSRKDFNTIHKVIRELPGIKSATPIDFDRKIRVVIEENAIGHVGAIRLALSDVLIALGVPTDNPVYTH